MRNWKTVKTIITLYLTHLSITSIFAESQLPPPSPPPITAATTTGNTLFLSHKHTHTHFSVNLNILLFLLLDPFLSFAETTVRFEIQTRQWSFPLIVSDQFLCLLLLAWTCFLCFAFLRFFRGEIHAANRETVACGYLFWYSTVIFFTEFRLVRMGQ